MGELPVQSVGSPALGPKPRPSPAAASSVEAASGRPEPEGDALPAAPASRSWRPRRRTVFQAAGLALAVALWSVYLHRTWGQLGGRDWRLDYGLLGAAGVCWAVYFLMLAAGWVLVARQCGQPVPLGAGVRFWAVTMPARYVPGNVWHVAGRVYLATRRGFAAGPLVLASAVEQVLTVLGAALVGLALALAGGIGLNATAVGLVIVIGLAAVHPGVLRLGLGVVGRVTGRRIVLPRMSYRGLAATLAWYVLANVVSGLGFWLLVASLGEGGTAVGLPLVGAYALAYVAGYLSFVTPAGIGAREAALVVLLGGLATPAGAVAASLLARAASAAAEVACVAAIAAASRLPVDRA